MAGLSLGAAAPESGAAPGASQSPRTTRTRRSHGVVMLGNQIGAVYSSRRESDGAKVLFEVGADNLVVAASMTALQARAMARALIAAADAVRQEVSHG